MHITHVYTQRQRDIQREREQNGEYLRDYLYTFLHIYVKIKRERGICDTDSVIFLYDETNPEHKSPEKHKPDNFEFGGGLGQWEDEFGGKDYIEELVIGGGKSYAYKTKYGCTKKGKIQVKQKGITLDMSNDEVVNFDTMRDTVLNTTEKGPVDPKKNKEFDPTRQIKTK